MPVQILDKISEAVNRTLAQDAEKLKNRKSKRQSRGPTTDELEDEDDHSGHFSVDSLIDEDEEELMEDRDKWQTDDVVILHLIGYVVGLYNFWRFPFLCYHYGGIAFLIPYLTFLLLCAYPFVYLELLVGQFAQVGTIAAFKLVPLFRGVGMCMTLMAYLSCFNVQSVLGWCLFYLFQSMFHTPLPWISCDNGFGKKPNGLPDAQFHRRDHDGDNDNNNNWHTASCTEFYADSESDFVLRPNQTLAGTEYLLGRVQRMYKSGYADTDATKNYTLANGAVWFGLDKDKKGLFEFNTDTATALIISFLIVQTFIQRGTKMSGKLLTAFIYIPYIILALLFYRASGLAGAWDGYSLLFKPRFEKLKESETWWRSAEQVFRSTGGGLGVHLTIASHNRNRKHILTDATVIVALNTLTSVLASMVVFMFLGHLQYAMSSDITQLITSGPELVFQVMADVIGILAKANFYSFCFYLMLFLVGLTTVTASLACTKTSCVEVLPVQLKYSAKARFMLVGGVGLFRLATCSLNLTRGGLHMFAFMETFLGSLAIIVSSLFFLVGIAWFWGLEALLAACQEMGVTEPGIYFQLCWKYISILILIYVFCGLVVDPLSDIVIFAHKEVPLSTALKVTGYVISTVPLLTILYGAFLAFTKIHGKTFRLRLLKSISPSKDHKHIDEEGDGVRAHLSHYLYLFAVNPNSKFNFCWRSAAPRTNQVAPEQGKQRKSHATSIHIENEPTFKLLGDEEVLAHQNFMAMKREEEQQRQNRRPSEISRRSRKPTFVISTQKTGACLIM